jgi:hypothetical protein
MTVNTPLLALSKPLKLELVQKANPAWVPDADKKLSALLDAQMACNDALDATKINPDLSPDGRRKAGLAVGTSLLTKANTWKAVPGAIADRLKSLWSTALGIAALKPPTDPAERLAFELRQREIRDELRPLDPLQRLLIYFSTNDPEVLAAIETAPPTLTSDPRDPREVPKLAPFIDPERVRTAMLERVRASDPELAAEMQALAVLHDVYQSAVDTVISEILREFPALAKDPLVAQAAGR